MLKDPTEFRKRFAAWKDGEQPYKGGKPSAISEVDKSDADFAKRLRSNWRQETWDWEGSGKAVTHKIGSADNIVYPNVQTTKGGGLIDFTNPIWKGVVDPLNRAIINKDYVPMKTEQDAIWFGPNYKEYYPKFKDGKLPGYETGKDPYDDTVDFLKQYEGFRDTTYKDSKGISSIGYGFTDSSLVNKGRITRAEADRQLRKEILAREAEVSKLKNWDKLSESSKTALRSYYYNYPAGFKDSTKFIKYWNAGDYQNAIREVDAGMNDASSPGLRTRRLKEQEMLRSDPFLMRLVSQFVSSLEEKPQFEPVQIEVPVDRTDFSLQNTSMQSTAPRKLNVWTGSRSPAYGGASVRMPSIQEYMTTKSIMPVVY